MSQTQANSVGSGLTSRRQLVQEITACWRTQVIHVAVQLNLPDHLQAAQGDLATVTRLCQCSPDGLLRLLRALCVLEVCRETDDGRYELTDIGEALCQHPRDGLASLRALSLLWGDSMWSMWGDLTYSVRTGASARMRQTGKANYTFLESQPDLAKIFHDAMQAMTCLISEEVAQLETWHGARTLVDVGGGNGTLAAAIAMAHPNLHVTVLDRADAKPDAGTAFGDLLQSGQSQFIVGDFFTSVPAGADRYLLKSILHNWDDAACQKILAACANAATPNTRLLIIERVRPERLRSTIHDQALVRTDLNMLAGLGGRERSLAEFGELIEPFGFKIKKVSPLSHEFSVVEAIKA